MSTNFNNLVNPPESLPERTPEEQRRLLCEASNFLAELIDSVQLERVAAEQGLDRYLEYFQETNGITNEQFLAVLPRASQKARTEKKDRGDESPLKQPLNSRFILKILRDADEKDLTLLAPYFEPAQEDLP